MTSSTFVSCRTGKSAGFVPLRMRAAYSAITFEQLVDLAPGSPARDLLRIDTRIAGNCCDSHHSQSNFFVAYAPLALGRKKLRAARSPRGGRARDRMLLIPVLGACKVKKPVQNLVMETWPVLRIFGWHADSSSSL
jgi:hypothetical protein